MKAEKNDHKNYDEKCVVHSVLISPVSQNTQFEIIVKKDSAVADELMTVIFNGRRKIPGVTLGSKIRIKGIICESIHENSKKVIYNPEYTLL